MEQFSSAPAIGAGVRPNCIVDLFDFEPANWANVVLMLFHEVGYIAGCADFCDLAKIQASHVQRPTSGICREPFGDQILLRDGEGDSRLLDRPITTVNLLY